MRLGLVDSARSDVFGGTETALLDLARHARGAGHQVMLVARPRSVLARRARDSGVHVTELPLRSSLDLPSILALRRWLKMDAPAVVLATLHRDARMLGLARLPGRRPPIAMLHGLPMLKDKATHALTYRHFVEAVLAPTEWLGAILKNYSFMHSCPVHVAPDGIDERPFPALENLPAAREQARAGLPSGRCIFLSAGRLIARKNFSYLLPLLASLPGETDWEWRIAGEGPERHELEAEAVREGIGDRTRFLGERSDLPALLLQADALLVPSHSEQLPLIVLEAVRAGVPNILVSRAGASREMQALGAVVIPLEDSRAWTRGLGAAAQQPGGTRSPRHWDRGLEAAQAHRLEILAKIAGAGEARR